MGEVVRINTAPPLTRQEEALLELLESNPEDRNYALYVELCQKRERWLRTRGYRGLSGLIAGPQQ